MSLQCSESLSASLSCCKWLDIAVLWRLYYTWKVGGVWSECVAINLVQKKKEKEWSWLRQPAGISHCTLQMYFVRSETSQNTCWSISIDCIWELWQWARKPVVQQWYQNHWLCVCESQTSHMWVEYSKQVKQTSWMNMHMIWLLSTLISHCIMKKPSCLFEDCNKIWVAAKSKRAF